MPILNYFDYNKNDVFDLLKEQLGYRPYASKHDESLITKFFQQHILPEKYNIDKRKAHYSNLIISNQMDRSEALSLLSNKPYDEISFLNDKDFFLKKLNFTDKEFEDVMKQKPKDASDYPSNIKYLNLVWRFIDRIRKFTR